MSIMDMDKAYVAGTYKRFPVEIVSGKGGHAVDSQARPMWTWAPASA